MNKIEGIEKLHSAKPDLAISDIMANKNYEGFKLNQQILKSSKKPVEARMILSEIDKHIN